MLTQEALQKNQEVFKSKSQEYVGPINDELVSKVANASWDLKNENNCAYNGSLLQVVLYTLIPMAIKINETMPENLRVMKSALITTLLIQHIGKASLFVPNPSSWEVPKFGKVYYIQQRPTSHQTWCIIFCNGHQSWMHS